MARTVQVSRERGQPVMEPTMSNAQNEAHELDFGRRVLVAVDALPFDQAEAIWLVDICSLGYVESARHVRRTPQRVRQLVRQARRQIRTDLDGAACPEN